MEQWRRDELKSVDQLHKEVTSEDKPELNAEIWRCKSPEEPVQIFRMPSEEEALAKMKDMAARLDQASRPTDEHIRMAVEQVAANLVSEEEEPKEGLEKHIVPLLDQLEEDEEEPKEATPVEKLIDTVKMVFELYPHLRMRLPIAMLTYAEEAQEFLDADTCLRERIKELEGELEGEKVVRTCMKELAKVYKEELDKVRENKTD